MKENNKDLDYKRLNWTPQEKLLRLRKLSNSGKKNSEENSKDKSHKSIQKVNNEEGD